jgi:hypothetical protein
MESTMNRLTRAVVAVAVLVGACSESPTKPESAVRTQMASAEGSDLSPLARYTSTPPNLLMAFSQRLIGPAGGSVRLFDFEIIVPPGAVSKPTKFSIRLPADPTLAQRVFAEFTPHAQSFAVPVTIRLPYQGTTAEGDSAVHVLWFNGVDWVAYATTLTGDGRIQTTTNHFSDYGTEENAVNRGITLSGKRTSR